jgi:hypothetical protein
MIDLTDNDSQEDPETCFRRGYQQGAYDALKAIETTPIDKVRDWVNVALVKWRLQDRTHDRGLRPPRP